MKDKWHPSWNPILTPLIQDKRFFNMLKVLLNQDLCPPKELIFEAFKHCNYDKLSVVMVGQDPYYQKGVATGLAFANRTNTLEVSPSLDVIIDELKSSYEDFNEFLFFDRMDLKSWATQGVLLYNSALTTRCNTPKAHTEDWKWFSQLLLGSIKRDVLFVFIGSVAKQFKPFIKSPHTITVNHPAYDIRKQDNYFRGSRLFLRIDEWLARHNKPTVNW